MDTASTTKDHVSYVYSREVILKRLLETEQITRTEFERYNRLLYDRYHIDGQLGVPRPIADQSDSITTPNEKTGGYQAYASLTEAAREVRNDNPGYVIQSWLRDSNTHALLKIWELILELEQYENEDGERKYPFPHKLTEYHDTLARFVFNRIQVFEDGHLLIRFKSGEEVEQKLDF